MRITCIGGGPAGLYFALLMKKQQPGARHQRASSATGPTTPSAGASCSPTRRSATCSAADARDRRARSSARSTTGTTSTSTSAAARIRSGGHGFCGIGRKRLLNILQARCEALGVKLVFETRGAATTRLPDADLDHRQRRPQQPHPHTSTPPPSSPTSTCASAASSGSARTSCSTPSPSPSRRRDYGWFQAHAYQFDGDTSTFIVETPEDVWREAGLDRDGARRSRSPSARSCSRSTSTATR